ncbi:MAG: peptidoglycan DD-metalloendopeptidase family protein [bacterium]|nr:peptidoglycan DD-metalloendopeptidase family protein [bacterium]
MKTRHLLTLIIVIFALFGTRNFVSASTTQDEIDALNKQIKTRQDTIKQLQTTIDSYKKNIDEKATQAVSLKNQLSILDNRLAQIEANIQLTATKISEVELQIEAFQLAIADKETVMAKQKTLIGKMVQEIHAEDQKNYVEIMLTNDSFSAFYDQLRSLENVYTELGQSVKTLRLVKADLTDKKLQVESKRRNYEELRQQLMNQKQDLADQANGKQNLLTQTKSSEARYRTLLDSLKATYQKTADEERAYEDQLKKKLEQNKLPDLATSATLDWPVPSRYITANFHDPSYPFRKVFEHSAIDIRATQGTPVHAAASGYVARAKRCTLSSCYAYVLIVHTTALSTLYGHLSNISVTGDQFVNKGDIIGYSGGTPGTVGAGPFVTGPHLHFETRLNGIPVNPLNYL